jgi:hypothetical protein
MDLKLEAEVYRLGLLSSYFTNDDVINWADRVIVEKSNPDLEIIDVALSKRNSKQDLANLLEKVQGEFQIHLPFKILIGLYSKRLKTDKLLTFSAAQQLSSVSNISLEDEHWELNDYALAFNLEKQDTRINLDKLISDFQQFIGIYESFAERFIINSKLEVN